MVEERVGVDGAEERVHPLPGVVDVVSVEVGVEVPDPVEGCAGGTPFDERPGPDGLADQRGRFR